MKPFNLEEYLKNPNQKVVTRDGRPVRIICIDELGAILIVALFPRTDNQTELVLSYTADGKVCGESYNENSLDLMFAPIKKEGWVNLFKINSTIITGEVYNTEEEAKSAVISSSIYISTVKVEWEE